MRTLLSLSFFAFLIVCAGCGKNIPLHGTVTYIDDGSPLERGTVCFEKGNILSRGEITTDGKYVVGSENAGDGIPLGIYRVYIVGANEPPKEGQLGSPVVPLIGSKFNRADTSDIVFTVDGKNREFNFSVDRAKK